MHLLYASTAGVKREIKEPVQCGVLKREVPRTARDREANRPNLGLGPGLVRMTTNLHCTAGLLDASAQPNAGLLAFPRPPSARLFSTSVALCCRTETIARGTEARLLFIHWNELGPRRTSPHFLSRHGLARRGAAQRRQPPAGPRLQYHWQ